MLRFGLDEFKLYFISFAKKTDAFLRFLSPYGGALLLYVVVSIIYIPRQTTPQTQAELLV